MTRAIILAGLAVLSLAAPPRSARAGGVFIESHVAREPDSHAVVMDALGGALLERGYQAVQPSVVDGLVSKSSPPLSDSELQDVHSKLEQAHDSWITASFQRCIFGAADGLEALRAAPAAVSASSSGPWRMTP